MKANNKYLYILAFFCYVVGIIVFITWFYFDKKIEIMEKVDKKLEIAARNIKYILPEDYHDRAVDKNGIDEKEYLEVMRKMSKAANENGFIYYYTFVYKNGTIHFTADSATPKEFKENDLTSYWEEYKDQEDKTVFTEDVVQAETASDKWGTFRSVLISQRSPKGHRYVAGVDYDIGYIHGLLLANVKSALLWLVYLSLLIFPFIIAIRYHNKKYTSLLEMSRKAYRFLFEHMVDGFALHEIVTDEKDNPVDYKFLSVNPAFETITGLKAKDVVGKTVLGTLPNLELVWIEKYASVVMSGKPIQFEEYSKELNKYFEVQAFRTDPGQFACIFQDITDRRNVEDELRKDEAELRAIYNSAPLAMFLLNRKQQVIKANAKACELSGYNTEEITGRTIGSALHCVNVSKCGGNGSRKECKRCNKCDVRRTTAKTFETSEPARCVDASITVEIDNIKKELHLLVSTALLNIKGNELILVCLQDITASRQKDEKLKQSEKMNAIGQLAGGVAHDFNNILCSIMGMAQLLKFPTTGLDKEAQKDVDMIMQASERAAELTSKLLAFGRKGNVTSSTVNIFRVVDDTVSILNRTINKKINISVKKNAKQHSVTGDFSALQNALMNLCINSSHAMPEGGNINILINNTSISESYCHNSKFDIRPGKYVEIEVRDSGCGIPLENIDKIFEPFYTTKEKGEGTGLGLSAVYGTVQSHHGAVNVYSEAGKGTSFHIILPCSHEISESSHSGIEIRSGSGQTILLVDDEALIRESEKRILSKIGYKVLVAKDGIEAVEIFRNENKEIDLVVLDIIMPRMNGHEAFIKIKEINNKTKVLITSGFARENELDELRRAGAADFIRKPYRDFELSRKIADILNNE